MTSGALLVVYPVASNALNNPPPAPGALMKKFCDGFPVAGVKVENPRPPNVVCGASTANATAPLSLAKLFTARKPYCRAQVQPTTYAGSSLGGGISRRFT